MVALRDRVGKPGTVFQLPRYRRVENRALQRGEVGTSERRRVSLPVSPPAAATSPTAAELLLDALNGQPPDDVPRQLVEFLRQLPIGILITDDEGREVHRNEIARDLIGQGDRLDVGPGGPAITNRLFRCGTDETLPAAEVPLLRALRGERSAADVEVNQARCGRLRLRTWGAPLLDPEGRVRFAIAAFVDVTAEKLLEEAVRERSRALERERLAEAIHDDVLQDLAAARLLLSAPRRGNAEAPEGRAVSVDGLLLEAISQLRGIVGGLRPQPRDNGSLAEALSNALSGLRTEGVEVSVDDRLPAEPEEPARSTLLRVCEEAIANIHKHARARWVGVCLDWQDGRFAVSIIDDGIGFAAATKPQRNHFGLSLMEERIVRLGGELRVDSTPGRGTAVRMWVPDPGAVCPASVWAAPVTNG